jgi:hypothetical protein
MTAAELIAALQHCPPDTPVYTVSAQLGYVISVDLVPNWTGELDNIIMTEDAEFEEVPGRDKFFVYISSPY